MRKILISQCSTRTRSFSKQSWLERAVITRTKMNEPLDWHVKQTLHGLQNYTMAQNEWFVACAGKGRRLHYHIYRVIHEGSSILWDMILSIIVRKRFHVNFKWLASQAGLNLQKRQKKRIVNSEKERTITGNYTGCPRRNGQNFGRVFLTLNYTDITQNTYIRSWTFTEIMAIEKCGLLGCPRTVRRPWRHTHPLRMPGNEKPLTNIGIKWPWRDKT